MTNPAPARPPERPPIHVIDSEYDAIAALALQARHRQPEVAGLLLAELDRAEVHTARELPARIVSMHSVVTFLDRGSDASRTVELVYPQEADIDAGKVSILTPVGAGLIGLAQGDSILWPDRDGHERWLEIVDVRAPGA
ncbi:MAG: nucleoside diphosphate kinase regulator [Candidatus Sphingomonas phytovorans]|nr:nucleoside diphosphate kinase regulator [Sphingomonas sp.]WEJ99985.1 MAG: nucleoside diphosphate kinase regulator [Sphingomonas sp.]